MTDAPTADDDEDSKKPGDDAGSADSSEDAERQRAAALLEACQHLSQSVSPSQVAAMLDEAAVTYEKLGDRKALQDCRNVMAQFVKCGSLNGTSPPLRC